MELIFSGRILGEISNVEGEGLWMHGQFAPGDGVTSELADFFQFMTSPNNFSQDPPFPEDLLNEENWEVVDEEGNRRGISFPAVQPNGLISWRWRNGGKARKTQAKRRRKSR